MPWFSAFVVFAFVWFITLLVVLPLRLKTQGDVGEVVPGTPQSAPANLNMKRKLMVTTIAAIVVFVGIYVVITSGWIRVEDLDVIRRWSQGE